MNTKISTLLIVPFLAMMVFTGCDITQSDADKPVNSDGPSEVHVQMKVASTGQAFSKNVTSNVAELNDIDIDEIKLFVEEMKLKSIEDDSRDFEIENAIIKLPLDGSPLILAQHQIPAGVYHEFEIEIEKPDDDDVTVDDPDFRDETGSYSVVVKGLYRGEEFMFRSSEDFEIDIEMYTPLEISESGNSLLVVSIDVGSWFKGPNGEELDPTDMNNTELINENIERSFEAEEEMYEERDFEGIVESVDAEAGTFTLENGMKFLITAFTEIEDEDFATLEEVVNALALGVFVEAEGEYYTNSDGVNIVIEVEFEAEDADEMEVEESDFEGMVQSVDAEAGTFTLDNGLSLTLNSDSEIEDEDFATLEELADALDQGILVQAEGEYYTNDDGVNIVIEVEFETEDADEMEVEESDFEGMVQSVDAETGTFTLESGMSFTVTLDTEIEGEDFATLEEVADALALGIFVEAEGEYYTNSDGVNIVTMVEFVTEEVDEEEDEVEEDEDEDDDDEDDEEEEEEEEEV